MYGKFTKFSNFISEERDTDFNRDEECEDLTDRWPAAAGYSDVIWCDTLDGARGHVCVWVERVALFLVLLQCSWVVSCLCCCASADVLHCTRVLGEGCTYRKWSSRGHGWVQFGTLLRTEVCLTACLTARIRTRVHGQLKFKKTFSKRGKR